MGLGWDLTKGIVGAGWTTGRILGNSAGQGVARRQATRGSRAVRAGILGPWDAVPANAADFLDYTGVATPRDMDVEPWSFPLGRYIMPRSRVLSRGWEAESPIGITERTANRHTVVYAPTQVGKTTSIMAPWIFEAVARGYLVVTVDLKGQGDLLGKVQEYARAHGSLPDVPVTIFDYTNPHNSASWNWISDLADDSALEAAAAALVGRDRDNDPNREFRLRDLKWMRGLLEMTRDTGRPWTIDSLLILLDDHARLVRLVAHSASPRAKARLGDLVFVPEDEYYTKVQFLTTYLEPLNTPAFNRVTTRSGIRMAHLDEEPGLAIVTAPLADGRISEAVSSLFIGQYLNVRLRKFTSARQPVLLVLDEAPRLKDRLDLPRLLATSASAGVSVLLAVQEVKDLAEAERETILANCATHVLMRGAGPSTTDYISKRMGRRTVTRQTTSQSIAVRQGVTYQTGVQSMEIDVLGRNELAHPPGGDYAAVVHCADLSRKPILVDLARPDLVQV